MNRENLPSLKLFRIDFRVCPSAERPTFWPQDSGFLIFFLFARDEDDANTRAQAIAAVLPFERLDRAAVVHSLDGPRIAPGSPEENAGNLAEVWAPMEAAARVSGLSYAFAPISHAVPSVGSSKLIRLVIDSAVASPLA